MTSLAIHIADLIMPAFADTISNWYKTHKALPKRAVRMQLKFRLESEWPVIEFGHEKHRGAKNVYNMSNIFATKILCCNFGDYI